MMQKSLFEIEKKVSDDETSQDAKCFMKWLEIRAGA